MNKMIIVSAALAALAVVSVSCKRSASSSSGCPDGTTLKGKAPPDGTVQWCARKDGTKHGPWTEWYPEGTLETRGQYVDGKMDGHWVSYHRPPKPAEGDEAGQGETATKPVAAAPAEPAKLEEGDYTAGIKTGEWVMYYESGVKNRVKTFTPGSSEVPWVTWRESGDKWAEGTIVDMRNHGPYIEWHANGKLAAEGTYDKGEKAGEWKYWDPDGNPSTEPQGDLDQ